MIAAHTGSLVLALLGGATLSAATTSLAALWWQRRQRQQLARLGALCDDDSAARLLLAADGTPLFANREARRLWGGQPPLSVLATCLDTGDDSVLEAYQRLLMAVEQQRPERVDLGLVRPLADPATPPGSGAIEWWALTLHPLPFPSFKNGHPPRQPAASLGRRLAALFLTPVAGEDGAGAGEAPVPPGGNGQPVLVLSAIEITARRVIEEILLREREDLAEFVWCLPVGLYSADSAGFLHLVNEKLAEWLGETVENMVGQPLETWLADGNRPEAEGVWQGRVTFRRRSGRLFHATVIQTTWDDAGTTRTRSVVLPRGSSNSESDSEDTWQGLSRYGRLSLPRPMARATREDLSTNGLRGPENAGTGLGKAGKTGTVRTGAGSSGTGSAGTGSAAPASPANAGKMAQLPASLPVSGAEAANVPDFGVTIPAFGVDVPDFGVTGSGSGVAGSAFGVQPTGSGEPARTRPGNIDRETGRTITAEDVPDNDRPPQDLPPQDLPREGLPPDEFLTADFSPEDFPADDFPPEDFPAEDFSAGDFSTGDFSAGDFSIGDFPGSDDPEDLFLAHTRLAARLFRWLFDATPAGVCLLDLDGVVSDCNPAFERMSGRQRDSVIDHPLRDVLAADSQAGLDQLLQAASTGSLAAPPSPGSPPAAPGPEAPCEVQFSSGGPDSGPQRDAAAALYVAPLGDGSEGLVAHFIDTTARRTLEAQFAQAQKMQAMGQLAGGVAHDFNNLLTAMIGFCDLLLQRHGAGDPSFADIMQIKQNANRAANLVRQLLAFSRKQPLRPRLLDITDALAEMNHLLRRLLGESVTLSISHGRDVGMVRVDPGQFDQVIINLAVNARDAMPGGGRLTIRTRREHVDNGFSRGAEHVPAGDYVLVSVSDTGSGIPRENLARIFEPFFSTKSGAVGTGTGLGLSTVYGILRQTGGFVFVDSSPGQGSEFTIYLPRHSASTQVIEASESAGESAPLPPPPPPVPDLTGGEAILLVEDEDPVRIFAARALRNKGYTVMEAGTGEGALEILKDNPRVDVLVTDMVMPGMDGATLARQVRQDRPEIRVILISGYSEEAARGELTDSPDFHFLPKPFSLNQLAGKVRDVISGAPS